MKVYYDQGFPILVYGWLKRVKKSWTTGPIVFDLPVCPRSKKDFKNITDWIMQPVFNK